jgi:hypothetical protein
MGKRPFSHFPFASAETPVGPLSGKSTREFQQRSLLVAFQSPSGQVPEFAGAQGSSGLVWSILGD